MIDDIKDEFFLTEKYRPRTISDCILPDRLKKVFQSYVDKKEIPTLMLTGGPGAGKTTVAKAMCDELGISNIFINSSDERGIDTLRNKVKSFASTLSFTGGRKVVILDEADYLTPEAQAAFRGAIEEFSSNCSFIFTCNFKSKIIDALHSRCSVIDFTLRKEERPKMASQFLKRIKNILNNEGIEYEDEPLIKLIEKFFPDYRRILNELQRYGSSGKIDVGILVQISDIRNVNELIKYLREKNFTEMRKWVVSNSDIDASRIYRKIYDSLYDFFKPEYIPQAVIILAKYQYQGAFVSDQEINLVAALTELMVDVEMKE